MPGRAGLARFFALAAFVTLAALTNAAATPVRAEPPQADASPDASSDTPPPLAATASTFYVVAEGSDASTAPLTQLLVRRLQSLFDGANEPGAVWVIARPSWTPGDLTNQCVNDPGKAAPKGPRVIGGIILEATNTTSSVDPYLLLVHGWSKVASTAELISCEPAGFEKPTITWVANDLNGYGSRNGVLLETASAGALVFLLQGADAKYIALASAFGGQSNPSTVPTVNDPVTARSAVERIVNDLVRKLSLSCASPRSADIAPVCARLGLAAPAPRLR